MKLVPNFRLFKNFSSGTICFSHVKILYIFLISKNILVIQWLKTDFLFIPFLYNYCRYLIDRRCFFIFFFMQNEKPIFFINPFFCRYPISFFLKKVSFLSLFFCPWHTLANQIQMSSIESTPWHQHFGLILISLLWKIELRISCKYIKQMKIIVIILKIIIFNWFIFEETRTFSYIWWTFRVHG